MKIHIMSNSPYATGVAYGEKWGLYKSLCGIKEPKCQAMGNNEPTCKKCIKLHSSHKPAELSYGMRAVNYHENPISED